MQTYISLLTLLILLSSCEKKELPSIQSVVDKDLTKFAKNEIPAGLQNAFDNNRIIIFGETHYVQEHHEYIAYLLENISENDFVFQATFGWEL